MLRTFRKRGSPASDFRQTLHDLNQRYKQEWDRAERLQDELNHIKQSRAYRLLCWCRRLADFVKQLWPGLTNTQPRRSAGGVAGPPGLSVGQPRPRLLLGRRVLAGE